MYKLYRYVPPHRVGFLRRFGLKTGINFAYFGLESSMVFEGTTELYERLYRFNSKFIVLIRNGSLSEDPGGTPSPRIPRSIPGVF